VSLNDKIICVPAFDFKIILLKFEIPPNNIQNSVPTSEKTAGK
jgi:hypothetical protein